MIHIRREGERVRFGLNFYPLHDKYNLGVIVWLRVCSLRIRWSKLRSRLHVGAQWYTKQQRAEMASW